MIETGRAAEPVTRAIGKFAGFRPLLLAHRHVGWALDRRDTPDVRWTRRILDKQSRLVLRGRLCGDMKKALGNWTKRNNS